MKSIVLLCCVVTISPVTFAAEDKAKLGCQLLQNSSIHFEEFVFESSTARGCFIVLKEGANGTLKRNWTVFLDMSENNNYMSISSVDDINEEASKYDPQDFESMNQCIPYNNKSSNQVRIFPSLGPRKKHADYSVCYGRRTKDGHVVVWFADYGLVMKTLGLHLQEQTLSMSTPNNFTKCHYQVNMDGDGKGRFDVFDASGATPMFAGAPRGFIMYDTVFAFSTEDKAVFIFKYVDLKNQSAPKSMEFQKKPYEEFFQCSARSSVRRLVYSVCFVLALMLLSYCLAWTKRVSSRRRRQMEKLLKEEKRLKENATEANPELITEHLPMTTNRSTRSASSPSTQQTKTPVVVQKQMSTSLLKSTPVSISPFANLSFFSKGKTSAFS